MRTTTTYTQTVTIVTEDDGTRTITRSHHADTTSECKFIELSPAAQAYAIEEAISEEERTAYEWGSQTYFATDEILNAARDLEKSQPVEFAQDYGCSWYGTARGTGNWYHHPADWQAVTEQQHTGICYSMDMCDRWNEYARRIIAMQEGYEEATDRAYIHDENADNAADNGAHDIEQAERHRASFYNAIAERIEDAAEELTEDAARAVGNIVDGLIEGERDYYTSAEFWRDWYANGDERFTRDGARI